MNQADNESGSKAIDSLINYETVKVHTTVFTCRVGAIPFSLTCNDV